MIKGKFIDNLPKVYGIYTGGFLVFIILMAIAEQAGMSAKAIGISFVILNFWFAGRQEKIDEEFGFTEREDE